MVTGDGVKIYVTLAFPASSLTNVNFAAKDTFDVWAAKVAASVWSC